MLIMAKKRFRKLLYGTGIPAWFKSLIWKMQENLKLIF